MDNQTYHSVKGNILIVDDISTNLQLLAQILSEQGYKTRTAPNGQLALRSIDLTPPDLILLDIMMPTMNGYEVCQALKTSPKTKDIPVIFISALNEVFDKVKAFEVGGVDYITKPFHEQEVLARVSNQLIQRRLFQQVQEQNKSLESEIIERKNAQEETQFLLATTFALAKSQDFEESISIMLRFCCEFINWDLAEAWIPSIDEKKLTCSRSFYTNEPSLLDYRSQSLEIKFAPNIGLPGRIWSSKQSEWLQDISLEPEPVFLRNKIAAKAGLRAGFGVPVLLDEQAIAILIFFNKTPIPFQLRLMELIDALATQLGSILQRQLAEEKLKKQFQKEQLLNQLTQSIRSSLKLNTIFSTAVREIAISLGVDRVAIAQYFPEKQLWINISEYYDATQLETTLGIEFSDDNEIYDRLKQSEIVKIDDTNTCGNEIKQRLSQLSPGSWLFVPLKVDSKVWGSVCVVKENRSHYWQVFEVELLCAVADSVAIAIKQAQIYQEIQSYAQQLEETLTELKNTQSQLVQKAKMASLGQLVAGVAHEINNPVNFIYGNIAVAMEYGRDLLHLVGLYQNNYPQPVAEVRQKLDNIELDFIADDYPKLLNSMKDGASRISQIVLSLRNFSRLDEKEYKSVDIHEGIDNTLLLLQHRLNGSNNGKEIEVIRDYTQLPKIQCYASQLNQVFMNLIANAIDALETKSSPRQITITTKRDIISESPLAISGTIVILVADNGCGMSEKVCDQIFDPFFTTKPVGSGTGLGLAICHNIVVEKHRGQISCVSALDGGTEFMVQIPIDLSTSDSSCVSGMTKV